jgi:5-(carboxyamino)imidazole ribonucleotide synthase
VLIRPGRTIGVFGGGQLGRMLGLAARAMGYRIAVFDPIKEGPAAQVADHETNAEFGDVEVARQFAAGVDVVTFEFESVPSATLAAVAEIRPVRPSPFVLDVCRNRVREKQFLESNGIAVAPYRAVDSALAVKRALAELGTPAILKTADYGYDGKGQVRIETALTAGPAWAEMGAPMGVVEQVVEFTKEISVVVARGLGGAMVAYTPLENEHRYHVLDITTAPADVPEEVAARAVGIARRLAAALDIVGLLCVEMFVKADGSILVNETAPRPHNSGHLTMDACVTGQFEQHVRAICGLPLGETALRQPAVMVNLLGDIWSGGEPRWDRALAAPGVHLHLYGKQQARPRRKMGHLTATAETAGEARRRALAARSALMESTG